MSETQQLIDALHDEITALHMKVAEHARDTDRLDLIEKCMGSHLLKVGHRWYWSKGHGKPHRRVGSLREAVDALTQELKNDI